MKNLKIKFILGLLCFLGFSSCEKDEEPVVQPMYGVPLAEFSDNLKVEILNENPDMNEQ